MTGKHSASRIKVWPILGKQTPRVSETVARPVRTTIHTALATALVGLYSAKVHHLGRDEFATYVVLVAAAVNAVWVAVENRLERGLLREVPPKTVPVVDGQDGGNFTPAQQAKLREARRRIEARQWKKGIQ